MTIAPKPSLPAIPEYVLRSTPYVPGKPIDELERELGITGIIKLASNENPYGPSPRVIQLLNNLDTIVEQLRLYPDANHYHLRTALANYNNVGFDEIIIGNGSNEIIDFLVRGFCERGDNIVSCGAAFIAYKVCAAIHGVEYRESKIHPDLKPNLQEILDLCDPNTKIIFLPNPNNPTGTYSSNKEVEFFLAELRQRNIIVVLDSAYLEYVSAEDFPDPLSLYKKYSNLVVLRTFSKAYGLAGLRVGYGIAHPAILEPLYRIKMPFNVSNLALIAAQESLRDIAYLKKCYEMNRKGIAFLESEFSRLGVKYWPSQGNFVLLHIPNKADFVHKQLLQSGIITRPVAGFGLKEHLRITVGTEEQNKRLISAVEKNLKS